MGHHALVYLERSLAILQGWINEAKGGMLRKPKPLNAQDLEREIENFRGWAAELRKYAADLDALAQRIEAQIKTGKISPEMLDAELNVLRKIVAGEIT